MAIRLGENVKVSMSVGEEEVTCEFRSWDEMAADIKTLCTTRVRIRGKRRPDIDVHGPRIKFFDSNCIRVSGIEEKNVEDGVWVTLDCTKEGWQSKIPFQVKSTAAAYFEEGEALGTEEAKN